MTYEFRSAASAEHALTHAASASGPPRTADADDVVTAHDGDGHCVGHVHAARTDLTVPGEVRLTAAAIAGIDVDETHRGRGVLSGMIRRLLADAQARGQVLATITSPHSALHRRFGFGPAADACAVEVDVARARPVHRPASGGVEVVAASEALDVVVDVYERCARLRTGTVGRTAEHWKRRLAPLPGADGSQASEVAVHHDSTGRADGYVHYDRTADGVGVIRDLWGESPEIDRALWEHLLSVRGLTTLRSPRRPVDDPIRHAMADLRAYRVERQIDELWVRLLDVDVALDTRTYTSSTSALTLKVSDPILSSNNGTWRVDSYGSFRSQGEPDIELDIAELSAVFLGGTSFRELADAGRLVERRHGAVDDAHTLFTERPGPFCGTDR